jgi:radical SAM superfamily enzyme YgiQ (UPF0313 family)
MKILLVKPDLSPPTIAGNKFVELEPLELEYLAAALPDHDVELVDLRFDKNLERRISEFWPDVVASTAYSVHYYTVLNIMRTAKRIRPDVYTVVGGHHATLMPHDFNRDGIDFLVRGEGVFAFAELVAVLEKGAPPTGVAGLAVRANGRMVFTDPRNDLDRIDRFPFPDRNLTRRYRKKFFYLWWRPAALMRASAGCSCHCSFCPIWTATRGVCRYRSPESVARELATVDEGFVYFCDDNGFFDRVRMQTLAEIIKKEGIKKEFFFFSRPDAVVERPTLVEKWAESGLKQVFLGIEVVNTERLRPLRKKIESDAGGKAIHILKKNGIEPFVGFMILPDFTRNDFDRIYEYMNRTGVYFHELTILTPAPGSDLYRERKKELITENYELYDYLHAVLPTKLTPCELYRELANLYIRGYAPWRALRTRSIRSFPVAPLKVGRMVISSLRSYFAIRNAYKSI